MRELQRADRRKFLQCVGVGTAAALDAVWTPRLNAAPISPRDNLKITKLETFVLRNSWVFVKLSTNAGIVGWGEMLKDKSKTCAAGAKQVEPYLLGKDPRRVAHH